MKRAGFWVLVVGLASCTDEPPPEAGLQIDPDGPPISVAPGGPSVVEPGCSDDACCADALNVDSPCTTARWDGQECVVDTLEDGADCGEAEGPCHSAPSCLEGQCVSGSPVDCSAVDGPCVVGVCEPATGECEPLVAEDGESCADEDQCNGEETCAEGECIPGAAPECDDDNGCTQDACAPDVGCTYDVTVGQPCNDGEVCSVDDACNESGECVGEVNVCPCTEDAECAGKGSPCGPAPVCDAGECVPGPGPGVTCEDDDPCTFDACDPENGKCVFEATSGDACDDGNACTTDDACAQGTCVGTPIVCDDGDDCTSGEACVPETGECSEGEFVCVECTSAADCPTLPPCGGQVACVEGTCSVVPDSAVDCSLVEAEECHVVTCDAAANACVQTPSGDGAPCDDAEPCTSGDTCTQGQCKGGAPTICADGKVCTQDSCEAGVGCVNAPTSGAPCDDNNLCTLSDTCNEGVCQGTAPATCDDGNPCTQDTCAPASGCSFAILAGASCDDDDPCTEEDACSSAGTCAGDATACDCTSDADCPDDGNACNGLPGCVDGQCKTVTDPAVCVADNLGPCETSACDQATGECVVKTAKNGSSCSDGSECTTGDLCVSGTCAGTPIECNDSKVCTKDSCSTDEGCVFEAAVGDPCDDANTCSEGETCNESGGCSGGQTADCSDGNVCTADSCQPGAGCQHDAAVGPCDDGQPCTIDDSCADAQCAGVPVQCQDGDACVAYSCNQATGQCDESVTQCNDGNACTIDSCDPQDGCVNAANPCDDGDACTVDSCSPNDGCNHVNTQCSDDDPCTTDTCTPEGDCLFLPNDCDDDDACTTDTCVTGQGCSSEAIVCPDNNPCTNAFCDEGSGDCVETFIDCDDGDSCTQDQCTPTQGCIYSPVTCQDENPCTIDSCDPSVGCQHEAMPCDDGVACTQDACDDGQCVHVANDAACDDANACTEDTCTETGCAYVTLGADVCALQCEGKAAGEGCDDGDTNTTGDICLDGTCSGFVTYQGTPAGAQSNAEFHSVMRIGDAWWATGTDESGNSDRGWIAEIVGPTATVVTGTVREDDRYSALTDHLATTEEGDVLVLDGTWTGNSQIKSNLDASTVSGSGILAAWGVKLAEFGGYYLSGRRELLTGEQSWVVLCTNVPGLPCEQQVMPSSQGGSGVDFASQEIPRALGGYLPEGPLGPNVDGTTKFLLADDNGGGGSFFNDAFRHEGIQQTPWTLDYFDQGGSASVSRDVHALAWNNAWWVGTSGLLRGRWAQGNDATWTFLPSVLGQAQINYDFNGVWANDQVVIIAGTRRDADGQRTLVLITHPLASDHNSGANWRVFDLLTVGSSSNGNAGGALEDVWMADGTITAVGWVRNAGSGAGNTVHFVRSL